MPRCIRSRAALALAAALLTLTVSPLDAQPRAVVVPENSVVVLHGLGRSYRSMKKMAMALDRAGLHVQNIAYPSTDHDFEALLDIVTNTLESCCLDGRTPVHFVTHSLGGIILRAYANRRGISGIGRVVMLSPPNQGTELVDELRDFRLFSWISGPTGSQMGTGSDSVPLSLGPVRFELGVITGDRSFNPLYSSLIPGEDDGKVSVERAKVEGMKDFLVMPHSHSFIMNSDEVIRQTIYFLEHGQFDNAR